MNPQDPARTRTTRSKKAGLPPGSVVFVGSQKIDTPTIRVFDYTADRVAETEVKPDQNVAPYAGRDTVSWINIVGLHDTELITRIGAAFGIHHLVLEDIVSTTQRPKVEVFDDFAYVVVRMLSLDPEKQMMSEQVSIVFGKGWVLSFQERPGDVFDFVRERIRTGRGRIRKSGSDYLAYALLDVIVDNYFHVLETLGEEIEDLEEAIVENPTPERQRSIRDLRATLIKLRRAVWPLRELFGAMERAETKLISKQVRPYLRDAYDHAIQVIDIVESQRDLIGGLMDLFMTSISNRMNEIMKVLTIIATIFIPLTFIAGIYGMNFEWIPELGYRMGYPIVMLVMVTIAGGLLVLFRRQRWI